MRYLLILALLLCSCGFAAPWVDTENVYAKLYTGTTDYAPYVLEREDGVLLLWVIQGGDYAEVMTDALLTEWPDGLGERELRINDAELWLPAWDAVEAANEEQGWDAYSAPVSRVRDW